MEFTNEIIFNKNLIKNETVLLSYSGKLYREHSSEITIVYGFGEKWEYTQEKKMCETENGFEVSIELKNYDTFNFCFKNNYNIWDNNFGFNYVAPIEEKQPETIINEDIVIDNIENSEINYTENPNTSDNICNCNNNYNDDIAYENNNINDNTDTDVKTKNNKEIINDSNIDEKINNNKEIISDINIDEEIISDANIDKEIIDDTYIDKEIINNANIDEEIINVTNNAAKSSDDENSIEETSNQETDDTLSSLLNSILQTTKDSVNDAKLNDEFSLQSVDEVKTTNFVNCDDIFQELYEDISKLQNNNQKFDNKKSETTMDEAKNSIEQKNIIIPQNKPVRTAELGEPENDIINISELDELMNNVLDSIVTEEPNETSEPILNEIQNFELENSNLPALQESSEDFIDRFIDKSYIFIKKAWKNCKKLGTLIKQKAKSLLYEEK